MSDLMLQEQADYLAEHLLGWRLDGRLWHTGQRMGKRDALQSDHPFFDEPVTIQEIVWQPQNNIAQCFDYIIPAMEKLGYSWSLTHEFHDGAWEGMTFWLDEEAEDRKLYHGDAETNAAAIVEAAYLAIREKRMK